MGDCEIASIEREIPLSAPSLSSSHATGLRKSSVGAKHVSTQVLKDQMINFFVLHQASIRQAQTTTYGIGLSTILARAYKLQGEEGMQL